VVSCGNLLGPNRGVQRVDMRAHGLQRGTCAEARNAIAIAIAKARLSPGDRVAIAV
jgi:hypothetical protein